MDKRINGPATENEKTAKKPKPLLIAAIVLFAIGALFVIPMAITSDPFFLILTFIICAAALICLIVWLLRDVLNIRPHPRAEIVVPTVALIVGCLSPLFLIPDLAILLLLGIGAIFPLAGLVLGIVGIILSVKKSKVGLGLSIAAIALPIVFTITVLALQANGVAIISLM